MIQFKYLVLIVACTSCVYGASIINKCKAGDSKCAKEAAQALVPMFAAGNPEFGMVPIDPLVIKRTDASSPNLKLVLNDYTFVGLKDCAIKKVKYEKAQSKILLKLLCSGQLDGSYEMKGRLLILPIEGKGPIHVSINKIEMNVELNMVEMEKDGVIYWDIKNWRHSFDLKDKSEVVFENLFGGNDALAQAAKDVIKESGNEIIVEVGSKVIEDIINGVVVNVNEFFHHVPLSELTFD